MKKVLSLLLALTLVFTVGLLSVGCDSTALTNTTAPSGKTNPPTTNPVAAAQGSLQVLITDAPAQPKVTAIELTVSKIEVHKAGAEETETEETETTTPTDTTTPTTTAEPEDNTGWITLDIDGTKTFDLLKIKDLEVDFASKILDEGKYTQIRLTVDKALVSLEGTEDPIEATLPSGVLKFVHPFEIKSGETTSILMDFDATQSVNITGNNKVMVKPVVKLTTKDKENKPTETESPVKAGQKAAEEFILADATYAFDGIEDSLALVKSEAGSAAGTEVYTFTFQTAHPGHGDRTGETLAQVVTTHTAVITVNLAKKEVTRAVCDQVWDMLAEKDIRVEVTGIVKSVDNITPSGTATDAPKTFKCVIDQDDSEVDVTITFTYPDTGRVNLYQAPVKEGDLVEAYGLLVESTDANTMIISLPGDYFETTAPPTTTPPTTTTEG